MAFTQVTITGTYRTPAGDPAAGTVVFTPKFAMRNADTVVAHPTHVPLTGAGVLSVSLAATTDPGTAPLGNTYLVQEYVVGLGAVRSYHLAVPHTFPTLDLETAPLTEQVPAVAPFPTPGPPPTLEVGTVLGVGPGGSPDVDVVEVPTEHGGRYRLDFVLVQGAQGDPSVPIDGSVTDAKVAANAGIVADKLADGTALKVLTAAERTKLAAVAAAATANASNAQLRDRGTHTGDQAIGTVTGLQTALDTKAAVSAVIPVAIVDVRGDLIAATAADAVARLPAGTAGQVLTPDPAQSTGLRWSPVVVPAPVTLTDAATVAVDASAGSVFRLAANGNRTIAAPTNPTDGQTLTLEVTAAGGAARTIALTTGVTGGFLFGSTITALTATTSATTDLIECSYRTSAARWRVTGYTKGFA